MKPQDFAIRYKCILQNANSYICICPVDLRSRVTLGNQFYDKLQQTIRFLQQHYDIYSRKNALHSCSVEVNKCFFTTELLYMKNKFC